MRLLTAKGVEDEGRRHKDEEDRGRNQALRMRGSSVPKRLSWMNRCLRALRNRPRRRSRSRSLTVTG